MKIVQSKRCYGIFICVADMQHSMAGLSYLYKGYHVYSGHPSSQSSVSW